MGHFPVGLAIRLTAESYRPERHLGVRLTVERHHADRRLGVHLTVKKLP